jgi:DNA-nicking Smr family endonuclease
MTRKGRGRRLTPQEEKIWSKVAESTTPLAKPKRDTLVRKVEPAASPAKPDTKEPIPEFRVGEKAKPMGSAPRALGAAPVRMDHKAFTRMKRGRLEPEARIDLHGMTQAAAHPALSGFIMRARAEGKRLVLVITGKGRSKT